MEHHISSGDFPDFKRMQERLTYYDFNKFSTLDAKLIQKLDKMLAEDIARLMTLIPSEEMRARQEGTDRIKGGAFDNVMDKSSPFMFEGGEGVNAGKGETEWVVAKDRHKHDRVFYGLNPIDGKITGPGN